MFTEKDLDQTVRVLPETTSNRAATKLDADRAVHGLLNVGFGKDRITVACSDQHKEDRFRDYEHQQPAGSMTPTAVATGSAIGNALGGLTAAVGVATTAGLGILTAGVVLIPAGAVIGGFVGAMMTQGIEKELASYYDQAVTEGKILVAAEDHSERSHRMLAEAERVFAKAGAAPIELAEG